MKRDDLYISTIDPKAQDHGLGLEIAEYCTAWNMDEYFEETDAAVRAKLAGIGSCVLHAPFNELFPCAIDPKARELARFRYRQAIALARDYGAAKVVIHGGYNPKMYFPCWYAEQSILFWRDFLQEIPRNIVICLENVLEEEPGMLLDIVKEIDDPRLRICLDVGHVNAYSGISAMEWLNICAPYITHFHIHNNNGDFDSHQSLFSGKIPMKALLRRAEELCPEATYTLELTESEGSVRWLMEQGILED